MVVQDGKILNYVVVTAETNVELSLLQINLPYDSTNGLEILWSDNYVGGLSSLRLSVSSSNLLFYSNMLFFCVTEFWELYQLPPSFYDFLVLGFALLAMLFSST